MARTSSLRIPLAIGLLCASSLAQEITPSQLFAKVKSAYDSLQTYKSEGTVTADMNTGGMAVKLETSFSIVLKKPNLYLISWTQKSMPMPGMSQSGAVWSDGTQPYLYMVNGYSKMTNDEMAIASATGISGGAAFNIPTLFLPVLKEDAGWPTRMKDAKMGAVEKVGGEDCYVVSGTSEASRKETFWISKSRFLILKYSRSLESPKGTSTTMELTDEEVEEAIKSTGGKVTPESKKQMKDFIAQSNARMSQVHITGTSTELHTRISSPEVAKKDVTFALPAGTVLRESFFDGVSGGAKR